MISYPTMAGTGEGGIVLAEGPSRVAECTDGRRMCRDGLQSTMAEFATPEYLRSIDEEGRYPYEIYDAWVALGLFRVGFPKAYGGLGGALADLLLIAQDLAYWSHDLYAAYSISLFGGLKLLKCGSEAQKQELLPALMSGRLRFSATLAEPVADTDQGTVDTIAMRADGGWLLNGHKVWSYAAGARQNMLQVLACTAHGRSPQEDLSLYLVPNDAAGVQFRKLDTLGGRATGSYEVFFDDVFVPGNRLVGELQEGWSAWQECLPTERLLASAGCVGSAQKVVDLVVAHAKEREQRGGAAGQYRLDAHMVADMQTSLDAARLLMEHAAAVLEMGRDASREVAMARLFCCETYAKLASQGMHVLGLHGHNMDSEMQRHFRDAHTNSAGAATRRTQRDTIAASMGLDTERHNSPMATAHKGGR